MRFVLTLNIPTRSNDLVQEIIVEYPASSIDALYGIINRPDCRFIIVEIFYSKNGADAKDRWESRGKMLVNVTWIGKVKAFVENNRDR